MSRPWCPPPSRQASCSWSPPPVWWPRAWRPRQPWAMPDLPGEGKVQVPGRISVGLFVSSCVRPVSLSGVIVRPTSLSNCTCVAPEYCKQDDLVNQVISNVTHLVTTKISKGRRSDQPQTWLPRQLCVLHLPTHKQVSLLMQWCRLWGCYQGPYYWLCLQSARFLSRTLFSQTASTTTSPATTQCGVSRVPRSKQNQSWEDFKKLPIINKSRIIFL